MYKLEDIRQIHLEITQKCSVLYVACVIETLMVEN